MRTRRATDPESLLLEAAASRRQVTMLLARVRLAGGVPHQVRAPAWLKPRPRPRKLGLVTRQMRKRRQWCG